MKIRIAALTEMARSSKYAKSPIWNVVLQLREVSKVVLKDLSLYMFSKNEDPLA